MNKLIEIELKKLKGSNILLMCIIGNLIIPIISTMTSLKNYTNNSWSIYCTQSLGITILLIWPCLFGLLDVYIFGRDYIEDTYKNLLLVAVGKKRLALAKLITIFLLIIFISSIAYLFNIIGCIIGLHFNLNEFVNEFIRYIIAGSTMFLALLPINLVVLINRKSYYLSIGAVILYEILSFISVWSKMLASVIPIITVIRISDIQLLNIEYSLESLYSYSILFFISAISIVGILFTINNQDA